MQSTYLLPRFVQLNCRYAPFERKVHNLDGQVCYHTTVKLQAPVNQFPVKNSRDSCSSMKPTPLQKIHRYTHSSFYRFVTAIVSDTKLHWSTQFTFRYIKSEVSVHPL
jgi:hypothetical protein